MLTWHSCVSHHSAEAALEDLQAVQGDRGVSGLKDAAGGASSQKAKAEGGEQQEDILKGGR